jgi:hypothetical protein
MAMRSDWPILPLSVSTVDRLRVSAGATQMVDREALQARWAASESELSRILAAPQLDQIMLTARVEELEAEQDRIEFQLAEPPDELGANPGPFVARFRDLVSARDSSTSNATRAQLDVEVRQMRFRWKAWSGDDDLYESALGEPVE